VDAAGCYRGKVESEAAKALPTARVKIEGGKLWLRIFEQIQGAIIRHASGGQA